MRYKYLIPFLALAAWGQRPDSVALAIEDYSKVVAKCDKQGCREKEESEARDAALEIIQRLVEDGKLAAIAPAADAGEGRRLALRLMPDRQIGASPGAGGGTSLASLASVSELISAAIESGALQRNSAGTVTTLRVNPAGAAWLLSGQCPKGATVEFPLCIQEDKSGWRGLSLMSSFDSSRADQTAPGTAAGAGASASAVILKAKRGIASAGVRYDFYRPAEKGPGGFQGKWKAGVEALRESAGAYGKAYAESLNLIMVPAQASGLPGKLHNALLKAAEGERRATAEAMLAEFIASNGIKIPEEKLTKFRDARKELVKKEIDFFRDVLHRRLFSVEFQHQRPKDEPEYGSLRFIKGGTVGTHKEVDAASGAEVGVPNWSFTINAGANFFYDSQKVQKDRRLRDFHFSFQADHKIWRWKVLNQPTFTLAGYYQRLTDDAVLEFNSDAIVPETGIALPKPANVILKGTKGDVAIAQAKLTVPLGDSGVSFPMAVTWSNRTELLKLPGNDVRGHFGLLFDVDKLLSGLTGKAK